MLVFVKKIIIFSSKGTHLFEILDYLTNYRASLNITLCEVSSLYKDCCYYYYYYYYYYY